MPGYTTADIRNVAIVGHGGSGKTSLVEALLREAGAIHHTGLVEKGTAVTDYTDEEKSHGHSLASGIVHIEHAGKQLNIIDTPGYPEFIGFSLKAVDAVETVAVVINAAAGIEPVARRMMEVSRKGELSCMIVVNKIDSENLDLPALIEQVREIFGRQCLPINLPVDGGDRVVDCFANAEGQSDLGPVADAHTQIIEEVTAAAATTKDSYLEKDLAYQYKMGDDEVNTETLPDTTMVETAATPIPMAWLDRRHGPENLQSPERPSAEHPAPPVHAS